MSVPAHNDAVFKPALISAGLLLLMTGCATSRHDSTSRPPDWEGGSESKSPPEPLPAESVPLPPVVQVPAPVPPKASDYTWTSLARWSAQHGFVEPLRLSPPPGATYALPTSNGVFTVQTGNLAAHWEQLEFRLGFKPQLIGNDVFLHGLDLQKNLEPLLRGYTPVGIPRVIVIDPGHGGFNFGTRSVVDHRWEKEFTLDWARRLAPLLEQRGWQVWLTRTNDVDVSLPDRVLFAELRHADFFLSLHFNSPGSESHEQAGLETYCLTPAGMPSSLTRGYPDDLTQAFPNNDFDAENLQYAARLHRALLEVNGHLDRGVRRARFTGVLRGQRRPAVLIEGGYLSNLAEARKVADPQYRQRLAEAVAQALE